MKIDEKSKLVCLFKWLLSCSIILRITYNNHFASVPREWQHMWSITSFSKQEISWFHILVYHVRVSNVQTNRYFCNVILWVNSSSISNQSFGANVRLKYNILQVVYFGCISLLYKCINNLPKTFICFWHVRE
jgi:hypothetical protein